jgi:hypothetical protein
LRELLYSTSCRHRCHHTLVKFLHQNHWRQSLLHENYWRQYTLIWENYRRSLYKAYNSLIWILKELLPLLHLENSTIPRLLFYYEALEIVIPTGSSCFFIKSIAFDIYIIYNVIYWQWLLWNIFPQQSVS